MRKYYPIWAKLKAEKSVRIRVPSVYHSRVKKAIIKEKNIDIAHKFLLAEQQLKQSLVISFEGEVIYLRLITRSTSGLTIGVDL